MALIAFTPITEAEHSMKFAQKVLRKLKNHSSETIPKAHRVIDIDTYRKANSDSIRAGLAKKEISEAEEHIGHYSLNQSNWKGMTSIGNSNFLNIATKLSKVYESLVEDATKPPKILAKRRKEDLMSDGSFHQAIGRVLLMAQFFSMMPVKGVTGPYPKQLSFSWMNVRTWYSLTFIVAVIFSLALAMYKVLHRSITFNTVEPIIFRTSIIVVCVSALNLASKWPALMQYWNKVERDLPPYTTQMEKSRMAYRIQMVTFVAMMLSLCEHLLSVISAIYYSKFCPITDNPIKNFFLSTNSEIFYVFEYSYALAWYGKIENILMTFIWNYMDVFVMVMSIGLSSKFEQLNDNLFKFKGMHMPESFWSERRIQYRNLCILCEKVDNAISIITMISFSNNLYFICVQLLKSLNKMPSAAHSVYFYYSLLFLLGRTLAVSLYSSSVHDESRRPLRVIRCVPKGSWCPEVKRFAEDISSDLIALSGMKFFHLTRSLVLSVTGTIVTYELVLIQFHEDDGEICDGDIYNGTSHLN